MMIRKNLNLNPRSLGVLFLTVGLLMLAGAAWNLKQTYAFKQTAQKTLGKVVDYARSHSRDGTTFYPIVQYSDLRGGSVLFRSNVGSSNPGYRIGDIVDVLYEPIDPHDARIDSFGAHYTLPLILSFIGVIFSGVGSVPIYFLRDKKRWVEEPLVEDSFS